MIQQVRIENIGPFTELAFKAAPGVNVIIGERAIGKTTLLRAISMATRAPREDALKELLPRRANVGDLVRGEALSGSITVKTATGTVQAILTRYGDGRAVGDLNLTAPPAMTTNDLENLKRDLTNTLTLQRAAPKEHLRSDAENSLTKLLKVTQEPLVVCLWETPEADLFGPDLRLFARAAFATQAVGTQWFISTNNYALLKELELHSRESGESFTTHTLWRDGDLVRVESSTEPFIMKHNPVSVSMAALYDREIQLSLATVKKHMEGKNP